MGARRAWAACSAVPLSLLVASGSAATPGASAEAGGDPAPIAILAEFVPYERPQSPTDNLGPVDHAMLFHPGGTGGGDNLPCTPDRLEIETNRVDLTFDPSTGSVTGSAALVARCQFHVGEGCRPEERTVHVDFTTGILDVEARQIVGIASVWSLDRVTQIWGTPGGRTGHLEDPSCTFGDTNLGPIDRFELPWRLDLTTDPATGFLAADVVAGDPGQRVGWFEVVDPPDLGQTIAPLADEGATTGADAADGAVVAPGRSAGDGSDASGGDDGATAATSTTVDRQVPVFGPAPGDDEDTVTLWLAFMFLFVFLAAVYLGMRLRRRRGHGAVTVPGRRTSSRR